MIKKSDRYNFTLDPQEYASLSSHAKSLGYESVKAYLLDLHVTNLRGHIGQCVTRVDSVEEDPQIAFETLLGRMICGDSARYMRNEVKDSTIDLIMTSPPFGLVRKKDYGNEDADEYLAWFEQFGVEFDRILKPTGSLVIDIGGAWTKGQPTRSLYHFELLIMMCKKLGFHLAQEFFWWNPSKLPAPAEWVNIRKVRVKDAVNCVWWLSKTPFPKASNRRVLQPYSTSMKDLLKKGYKAKMRPSGHDISEKFFKDNGGAIPPNLIAIANTESNGSYQRYCRENKLPEHPARFPMGLPAFFIRMLTDKGDTVLDPFAGSGVTAAAAEAMGRRWLACELSSEYVEGSRGRFFDASTLLAVPSTISSRVNPYELYVPRFVLGEAEAPLFEDGGASRPSTKKTNAKASKRRPE